jgi:hypothetical protein
MPRRSAEDFNREIESHIAIETARLIAEGMPLAEARDAAVRRFGNVGAAEERFYSGRPPACRRWRAGALRPRR